MNRRKFFKYASAAVVGGTVLYATTYLVPPLPRFSYGTAYRTLTHVIPNSDDEVRFVNEAEEPFFLPPVAYAWSVDDKPVSTSRDYASALTETKTKGEPHIIELTGRRTFMANSVKQSLDVDPSRVPEYPSWELQIPVKGVSFRASALWGWYPSEEEIRECMWVVRNELGCNGVLIFGADDDRILQSGRIAGQAGIETILLSPRAQRDDYTIDEHVERIIRFSGSAERLRKEYPGTVLSVGNELTLDVKGLLNGSTYDERVRQWEEKGWKYQQGLDDYLRTIMKGVREHYGGRITYASAIGEGPYVPWGELGFDIIAPHLYPDSGYWTENRILEYVQALREFRKPMWISEFGSQTFRGASADAASAQYKDQPYDQEDQAKCIVNAVDLFQRASVDGIFLFCLFWPMQSDAESYGILEYVGTPHSREEDASVRLKRKWSYYAYQSYRL